MYVLTNSLDIVALDFPVLHSIELHMLHVLNFLMYLATNVQDERILNFF